MAKKTFFLSNITKSSVWLLDADFFWIIPRWVKYFFFFSRRWTFSFLHLICASQTCLIWSKKRAWTVKNWNFSGQNLLHARIESLGFCSPLSVLYLCCIEMLYWKLISFKCHYLIQDFWIKLINTKKRIPLRKTKEVLTLLFHLFPNSSPLGWKALTKMYIQSSRSMKLNKCYPCPLFSWMEKCV